MVHDIFISYSRKDISVVDKICEALDEQKIPYYIDRKGLTGGSEFAEELEEAIESSKVVLYIASNNSYESEFTKNELNFAFNLKKKGLRIVPYVIDGSAPQNVKGLKLILSSLNILNIADHPIETNLMQDLCILLKREYVEPQVVRMAKEIQERERLKRIEEKKAKLHEEERLRQEELTRQREAARQKREKEEEEKRILAERDWQTVQKSNDLDAIQEYMNTHSDHKDEAQSLYNDWKLKWERDNAVEIQKKMALAFSDREKSVNELLRLYHSYSSQQEYFKALMLDDMRQNPLRYNRAEFYNLVFNNKENAPLFTPSQILDKRILNAHQIEWIRHHPAKKEDYQNPIICPEENISEREGKQTDIYFLGVPGCGKSTILAGIFSNHGAEFRYKINGCRHIGGNFGIELERAVSSNNVFPSRTTLNNLDDNKKDKFYLQIQDGEIIDKDSTRHDLSFIEMSGERTLALVTAKSFDLEQLGEGMEKLLTNENHKLLFFIIDPDCKNMCVNVRQEDTNGGFLTEQIHLTQAQMLTAIADFFKELIKKRRVKNIDAVHIILSKSDLLKGESSDHIIKEILNNQFAEFTHSLREMCSPEYGNINSHCGRNPYLYTFHIGDILPGEMLNYNPQDSTKIINVIRANSMSINSKSLFDSLLRIWRIKKLRYDNPAIKNGYEI